MPKFQPKTSRQMKAIFGLAKNRGIEMDDETRGSYAIQISKGRVISLSLLSFDEANALIKHLGGDPLPFHAKPRRTENYHRQQLGIHQIAQPAHLKLMHELANGRGISEFGLEGMGYRMLKHWPPRTTDETNKIIEALKAMNARDAVRSQEAA